MSATVATREDLMQEQILAAAKHLFQIYGLAKVTMDDVAKAIGKGRSSLYYYYKSKDEIFEAVVNIEINAMFSAIEKATSQAFSAEEKINALFLTKLNTVRERVSFFSSVDAGMDADAINNFKKTKIVHHDIIMKREGALLKQILTTGIANGELKPVKINEMDNLIFVMLSCLHGLKQELRVETTMREIEPVVKQFISAFLHGIAI